MKPAVPVPVPVKIRGRNSTSSMMIVPGMLNSEQQCIVCNTGKVR